MNSFFQSLKSQTNIPEGFEVVRLLLLLLFMDIPYLIFCCFDDFHRSTLIDRKEVNKFNKLPSEVNKLPFSVTLSCENCS